MKPRGTEPPGTKAELLRIPETGSWWRYISQPTYFIEVTGVTGPTLSRKVQWVGDYEAGATEIRAFNSKFEPILPSHNSR